MSGVKPMVFKSEIAVESVLVMFKILVEELPHSFPSKWVTAVRRLENRELGNRHARERPTHSCHNS
jgi:hypothetical protein